MANRRQHTIPRFYLEQFLSLGWVYRRGESAPRATRNARNVAVQRDYYGILDRLNRMVEGKGALALRKLIEEPVCIALDDRVTLSWLFANFAVRTCATIKAHRATWLGLVYQLNAKAEKLKERVNEALLAGNDPSELFPQHEPPDGSPAMTLDELNEFANSIKAKGGHRFVAYLTFSVLPYIAECIQQMSFLILEAPQDSFFVTSDRTLVLLRKETGSPIGAGWANNDALGLIALCPSHFLIMSYDKSPSIEWVVPTPNQVAYFNCGTIMFADQEIYSPFEYAEADAWMRGLGHWNPHG